MISNWAELSPENQARIADYAKILQKQKRQTKIKIGGFYEKQTFVYPP